ncbi:MAG: hypothetical protein K5886_11540 [Lachnospiraceae bacterium]|nr:hypothetical protein [Lachnospiraceae bacterium]
MGFWDRKVRDYLKGTGPFDKDDDEYDDLDPGELAFLDGDERREALEDAGYDPDDFDPDEFDDSDLF